MHFTGCQALAEHPLPPLRIRRVRREDGGDAPGDLQALSRVVSRRERQQSFGAGKHESDSCFKGVFAF